MGGGTFHAFCSLNSLAVRQQPPDILGLGKEATETETEDRGGGGGGGGGVLPSGRGFCLAFEALSGLFYFPFVFVAALHYCV